MRYLIVKNTASGERRIVHPGMRPVLKLDLDALMSEEDDEPPTVPRPELIAQWAAVMAKVPEPA